MTIAGLYVSPEGVVLGADSTSSYLNSSGQHYFNFAQKIFEIGEDSTLGFITWGMGGIGDVSYRTMLAELADDIKTNPVQTVLEVMQRWISKFSAKYDSYPSVIRAKALHAMAAYDPANSGNPGQRTEDEEAECRALLSSLVAGFCIAGYVLPDREPKAFQIWFGPTSGGVLPPQLMPFHQLQCWGMPNVANRLLYGVDDDIIESIVSSGNWSASPQDLVQLLEKHRLQPRAVLPLRDAIDYVHSFVYCTIKAIKFSTQHQVCGGPIEVAVISSDRKFRWVRHKHWDAAIRDGEIV